MSVSLTKDSCIPASRAQGLTILFPGGTAVTVTSVIPLPARSAHAPRVRLVGRTVHGGSVASTFPSGSGLKPAPAISAR